MLKRSDVERWHTNLGAMQIAIYEAWDVIVLLPIDTTEVSDSDIWAWACE